MPTHWRSGMHRRPAHEVREQANPTYSAWWSMVRRCTRPSPQEAKNYAARGITVCERWLGRNGFENFLADMGQKPRGLTLDRRDNDGPYSKENCAWVTLREQSRNKRTNRFLTWRGETKTCAEWSEVTGHPPQRIYQRLKRGWSVDRTLSTSPASGGRS